MKQNLRLKKHKIQLFDFSLDRVKDPNENPKLRIVIWDFGFAYLEFCSSNLSIRISLTNIDIYDTIKNICLMMMEEKNE